MAGSKWADDLRSKQKADRAELRCLDMKTEACLTSAVKNGLVVVMMHRSVSFLCPLLLRSSIRPGVRFGACEHILLQAEAKLIFDPGTKNTRWTKRGT